jgi:hypothetical protein
MISHDRHFYFGRLAICEFSLCNKDHLDQFIVFDVISDISSECKSFWGTVSVIILREQCDG